MGAELAESVPAGVMDERSGQSLTPVVGVGLDRLKPCESRAGRKQSHLGYQSAVDERTEPLAVPGFDEAPMSLRLRRDVPAVGCRMTLTMDRSFRRRTGTSIATGP